MVLLYVGIGAGLAVLTLGDQAFRRGIDRMANQHGMSRDYGRAVWLGGTVVFWPIGLYSLVIGRLAMADDPLPTAAGEAVTRQSANKPKPKLRLIEIERPLSRRRSLPDYR